MKRFIVAILATAFVTSVAQAQVRSGAGINAVANNYQIRDMRTKENSARSTSYGFDANYQFQLSSEVSALIRAGEQMGSANYPRDEDYDYYKTGGVGADARIWRRQFFAGVGYDRSYLTYTHGIERYTEISWTDRMRITAGLELDPGLCFEFALARSEQYEFTDVPNQRIMGTTIAIGRRW